MVNYFDYKSNLFVVGKFIVIDYVNNFSSMIGILWIIGDIHHVNFPATPPTTHNWWYCVCSAEPLPYPVVTNYNLDS